MLKDLIRPEDEAPGVLLADLSGLHFGQRVRHIARRRPLGEERLSHRRFIDPRRNHLECQPGRPQQPRARLGPRC